MTEFIFDGNPLRVDAMSYIDIALFDENFSTWFIDHPDGYHNIIKNIEANSACTVHNNSRNYPCMDLFDITMPSDAFRVGYVTIVADQSYDIILKIGTLCRIHLWMDDKLIYTGLVHGNDSVCILHHLDQGSHTFIAAIGAYTDAYLTERPPSFSLYLTTTDNKDDGWDSPLFKDYLSSYVMNQVYIAYTTPFLNGSDTFRFSVWPYDYLHISTAEPVELTALDMEGYTLHKQKVKFGKRSSIQICDSAFEKSPIVILRLEYHTDLHDMDKQLCIADSPKRLSERMLPKISPLKNCAIPTELEANIHGRIDTMQDMFVRNRREKQVEDITVDEYLALYRDLKVLLQIQAISGRLANLLNYFQKKRVFTYYYQSQLDQQWEIVNLCLPKGYDGKQKYPVIVCLDHKRYSWVSKAVVHRDNTQYIFADVSCRGYSMGGYIGEAAFLESMKQIVANFLIDKNRIYLLGISAGAFSALSLCSSYPDQFAALAVSCGKVELNSLENLVATPILNIGAKEELYHQSGYQQIERRLACKNGEYEGIVLAHADDNTIFPIKYSTFIYQWLLRHVKKSDPSKVDFYTQTHYHNHCNWLHNMRIEPGYREMRISARRTGKAAFQIDTQNVESFRISCPKDSNLIYRLNVNGVYREVRCRQGYIHLKVSESKQLDKQNYLSLSNRYMGTGLLHIFYKPIDIVVSNPQNSALEKISKRFETPKSFGHEEKLYVKYPIYTQLEYEKRKSPKNNNILYLCSYFDMAKSQLSVMLQNFPLQLHETGYQYQGISYPGRYCAMFILPNPNLSDNDILIVCSNADELLQHNFYLRNIYIPSYLNGQSHPYNNSIILLWEKKYFYARNYGDALEERNL